MVATISLMVCITVTFIWILRRLIRKTRKKPDLSDPMSEYILLPSHRIWAIGVVYMFAAVLSGAVLLCILTWPFDFSAYSFYVLIGSLLFMLAFFLYGFYLFLLRNQVVQLSFNEKGIQFADMKWSSGRRTPFLDLLHNKKFRFLNYSDIEKAELVELYIDHKIVIRTFRGDFTLPFVQEDKQQQEALITKINGKIIENNKHVQL